MKYKENTGLELNLTNPKTFNEKLWWLKLNNRDPLMTVCSDKYQVRDYVNEKGLSHILNRLIGVFDNAEDIMFNELPDKAFIKTNHTSGINYLWNISNSKKFNRKKVVNYLNKNLKRNYFLQSREYNYKNIPPKIVIEEYIEDDSRLGLIDYRFFCFKGNVELLFVDIDVAAKDGTHNYNSKRNIYDRDFRFLKDLKASREQFNASLLEKPKNYELMVEYAEILSEPFEFCRVDFYNIDGKIIFGEITFYPGGATQILSPIEWEYKLGELIDLHSPQIVSK